MQVRLLMLLLVPLMTFQCIDRKEPNQLVVEASITAGEPVENVRVRLIDSKGLQQAQPASNADVRLLSLGVTYILQEIPDKPGHYAYRGEDLEIIAGQEYMLWVQHETSVAVTSTVLKADSLVQSDIENGLGYFVARN